MNRDFPADEWSVPIELAHEPDFWLGQIHIKPSACEVEADKPERVEPRVMQALVALAQRKGAVVSRDALIQRCWAGRVVGEDAINRCIGKVRKLAEIDRGQSFRVETIPKIGLRLIECAPPLSRPSTERKQEAEGAPTAPAHPRSPRTIRRPITMAGVTLIAVCAVIAFVFVPGANRNQRVHHELSLASPATAELPPSAAFRDCAVGCPDMVVIPSGYFMMGSARNENAGPAIDLAESDDESPQHEVLIRHRFALARYDVTRGEYARFAAETHRTNDAHCNTLAHSGLYVETLNASWRHPGFVQTERDPVVCVSWYDADAYVNWLSRRTGKHYRLPSEAELEYAARAGSVAARPGDGSPGASCRAFNGGDSAYHALYPGDARFESDCGDGFAHTSPVGSFSANAFGLFDIMGNAAQWTADCYHESYDGAPTDGSAWITGDCAKRVVRGGSWESDSRNIRFARRDFGAATSRWDANTIRVARDF